MMKDKIDKILENSEKLQKFLLYVQEKSSKHKIPVKLPAIRAFYFDIDFEIDQERRLSLLLDNSVNYLVCGSFFARVFKDTTFEEGILIAEDYDKNIGHDQQKIGTALSANKAMYIALKYAIESEKLSHNLRDILENLYQNDTQFDNNELDEDKLKHLANESRSIAKNNRKIGVNSWEFDEDEKKLLKTYYEANLLLVECLNTDCMIDNQVRKEILNTLVLPLKNI